MQAATLCQTSSQLLVPGGTLCATLYVDCASSQFRFAVVSDQLQYTLCLDCLVLAFHLVKLNV
jgi:hypothetical protein